MKIAILINELTVRGGTHKQVQRLGTYLVNNGHDVELFTKKFDKDLCYSGIVLFKVKSYDKYFFRTDKNKYQRKLLEFIGYFKIALDVSKDYDIINIHDNGFALSHIFIKKIKPNSKIVWQINDLPHYFRLGNLKGSKGSLIDFLGKINYKKAAKLTDKITVNVTKNTKRVNDIYSKTAEVVYCGVDLTNKELNKPKISKPDNYLSLLSIGVLFPYRNYETLIKVIDSVNKNFNIICDGNIIGSISLAPDYAYKLQNIINESKINCKIHGDISEKKLIDIYNNSDIFLFLNIDQSWGLTVFEAMNMGIPVIVSKSVGATELLKNNEHVYIVDPQDVDEIVNVILRIKNNRIETDKMVSNAFNHTLNMSWDNMYSKRILEIFTELHNN